MAPHVGGIKLGLEFVTAQARAAAAVQALGLPIFLDLKFHDILNTVAGAVREAARLGVAMLTLHAAGGRGAGSGGGGGGRGRRSGRGSWGSRC